MVEPRTSCKVLIALPIGMLEDVDEVADAEHRTRSDLIRESLRAYLHQFKIKRRLEMNLSNTPIQNIDTNGAYV